MTARASAPPAPPARPGCRVLSVRGKGAQEPGAPKPSDFFDGAGWLELRPDIELTLRHSETAREFALRGPGKFQPCPAGAETVLVARGSMSTSAGPGARPGAEVLLGTPFAALRLSDAELTLEVREQKLHVRVLQGSATVEKGPSPTDAPPPTVSGPKGTFTLTDKIDTESLVRTCRTARTAAPGPHAVPSAGAELGQWAAARLTARRTARYACARADAALARLEGPELARLTGLLEGSEPTASPRSDGGK